jgi:hypothetical protein
MALAAAAVVVIAVLAVLLTRGGGSNAEVIGPKVVEVPGTRAWTSTGLVLRRGDRVSITASGTVFHNVGDPQRGFVGPAGATGRPELRQFNVLKDADHGALLGRVAGKDVFVVGAAKKFTAAAPGALELGVNDAGLENNSGAFVARVTVTRG